LNHQKANKLHPGRATVVTVFAEALSAPEVAWSLLDAGFNVTSIARRGRGSALRHSRKVVCHEICPPEQDMAQALRDMVSVLNSCGDRRSGRILLFPLDDTALWMCNELSPNESWILVGPGKSSANLALNKCQQTRLAREVGFKVPETGVASSVHEATTLSEQIGFPIVLKPVECTPVRNGRKVGRKTWICANANEFSGALREWNESIPLLLQKYIIGVGEGVFGLATPEGVQAWSAHRRLRMMNPQGSGASACVSIPVDESVRQKTEVLIGNARWTGLFMVELLRDRSGEAWFVELNGRPWGSMALARRQGLEYPAWSAFMALANGWHLDTTKSASPGLVCRNLGRELMYLLFALRGPKSEALVDWPSFWTALRTILRTKRGERYYNWRSDDRRVFFADCFYTLRNNLFKAGA
jgi:predicted ATP-grasp superfamily ATP-dependent carboligase